MIYRFVAVILLLITASVSAWAQTGPNWPHGKVPTAAEWQTQWEGKLNAPAPGSSGNLMMKSGTGLGTYAGSACPSGQVPNGLDANGTVTSCAIPQPAAGAPGALQTKVSSAVLGAYAGSACDPGEVPNGLDASGAVTGCAVAGGGSPANPSGLIGMTAANGAASTFGRSDSTHAIDPAIAPTWIGLHTFNGALTGSITNSTAGNAADRSLASFTATYDDTANVTTGFSDANLHEMTLNNSFGQYSCGGATCAKWTFFPLLLTGNYVGSGQRFLVGKHLNCYGFGDCFGESNQIVFAGANINGDEGVGYAATDLLTQQRDLSKATISGATTATTCNTQLAQGVTGSAAVQDVSIDSTVGCADNDWVVIDNELPTVSPNHEAVQITRTGVAAGKIRGVFRNNHTNGHVVTPARVANITSLTDYFGQGRWVVDLTAAGYSTGTIATFNSPNAFVGSGTSWAGLSFSATNPLCIAFTPDDYTGLPFAGGASTLKSWYPILSVSDNTHLTVYKTSVAADNVYHGAAPGAGGYIIRPCAETLVVTNNNGTLVLATSTGTWSASDSIESAIAPWPDVTGRKEQYAVFTPGGQLRAMAWYSNTGARTFDTAITVDASLQTGGGADTLGYTDGIKLSNVGTGLHVTGASYASLVLPSDATGTIQWGSLSNNAPANTYIGPTTVNSVSALMLHTVGTAGPTDVGALTLSFGDSAHWYAGFNGNLSLGAGAGATSSHIQFQDGDADPGASTRKFAINYVSFGGNSDSKPKYWASNSGLTFWSVNDDKPSGTTVFVMAGDNLFNAVGSPELGTATAQATQYSSGSYRWEPSIWTGSVARAQWWQANATYTYNVSNSHTFWELQALTATVSYNQSFPDTPFMVRDDGYLSFGLSNPGNITSAMVNLDPTGVTVDRVFAFPDAAGTIALKGFPAGQATLTLTAGAIGLPTMTASASAPGAAGGKVELVCGTAAGSVKLIAYGGTSSTAATVLDNIGSGATGC